MALKLALLCLNIFSWTSITESNPVPSPSPPNVNNTGPGQSQSSHRNCMLLTTEDIVLYGTLVLILLVTIAFMGYLVIYIQCRKKPLRALDSTSMALNEILRSLNKTIDNPMHAILFLCYLNGIRKSILLREYEMDSMQRRAVVYAAFGVSDVFAAKPLYEKPEKKCKDDSYNEMDIHKRLIERYINWDQNVYMRNGRKGEQRILEQCGLQE